MTAELAKDKIILWGSSKTFCRKQKKVTKLSLKFPASWECVLDTMGLYAEDG